MSSAEKIPLKTVLSELDNNAYGYYDTLTEEEKKSVSTWVLMRFMSSSINEYQPHFVVCVNDLVNINFSALSKHPTLQWKLLCMCGIGKNTQHNFIPLPRNNKNTKLKTEIKKIKPHLKDDEVELLINISDQESLSLFFRECGYADLDIKRLLD